jgi:hypothetical protein
MAAWVNEVHRIIIAVAIQIQAVDGFGIQVGGIVGGDKSVPFGAVVSGVAVIQTGIILTIIATGVKKGALAVSASAYIFYHLPGPQSRKSLPGRG